MKGKIYLAAGYSRKAEIHKYKERLEAEGFTVVSTWTEEPHVIPENGDTTKIFKSQTDPQKTEIATRDLEELDQADTLVLFSEDPDVPHVRGGRHVEFGYALKASKDIYVIGPKENIFHFTPGVKHLPDFETLELVL